MSREKALLNKMLPSSIDDNETINIINEILQPYIDQNFKVFTPRLFLYSNIDKLDETMLNHLAYECHVDFYDVDLPIEKKRTMVKKAIKYHRYKGTPYAVEELLSDLFGDTWIEEWFEYEGDPYYFRIFVRAKDKNTKIDFSDAFMRALYTVKNTRSWLDSICIVMDEDIVIKDKTNVYTCPFYPVGYFHQCGTIFKHQYTGTKVKTGVKLPNGSNVREQRIWNVNEPTTGHTRGGKR